MIPADGELGFTTLFWPGKSGLQLRHHTEALAVRRRRASFIVTSNRDVSEWVGLFADPILANSALDRLANGAHQLVIDGPSYRAKLAPRSPQEAATP